MLSRPRSRLVDDADDRTKRQRVTTKSLFGNRFPDAILKEIDKVIIEMERKMDRKRAVRKEMEEIDDKINKLELSGKWPAGYSKPGVNGDPVYLDKPISEWKVTLFKSDDGRNPLRNVTAATTVAQLKTMVSMAWVRQEMHIDRELLATKAKELGAQQLLETAKTDIKNVIQARIALYKQEGFEVPTEWEDGPSLDDPIRLILNEKYKIYISKNADVVIAKKQKESKEKEKVDEAKRQAGSAEPKVALVATIQKEAKQVFQDLHQKGKENKKVDHAEAEKVALRTLDAEKIATEKRNRQMNSLLDPPPGLEIDVARAFIAKSNSVDDDEYFTTTESRGGKGGAVAKDGKGKSSKGPKAHPQKAHPPKEEKAHPPKEEKEVVRESKAHHTPMMKPQKERAKAKEAKARAKEKESQKTESLPASGPSWEASEEAQKESTMESLSHSGGIGPRCA